MDFNKKGLSSSSWIMLISVLVIIILVGGIVYYSVYIDPLKKQGFSCISDNQCNDNDLCTKDTCSTKTGICYNNKKTCSTGQKCDASTGECENISSTQTTMRFLNQSSQYPSSMTTPQSNTSSSAQSNTLSQSTISTTNPPAITISSPQNGIITSQSINSISYTVKDNSGKGLKECWYTTNNGIINSTHDLTCSTFTGLNSVIGTNSWIVYAKDNAGNIGNAKTIFTRTIPSPPPFPT